MPAPKRQTKQDREYILANLPSGTRRVQVVTAQGQTQYKRPDDVDLDRDEIVLSQGGLPVVMRGKPGRKKRIQLNPVTPQIQEVEEAREEHISTSSLVQEVGKDPESDDTFESIIRGMAEEASSMEFERLEAQRHGQDSSNHSVKRTRVLKAMADLLLKKKQIAEGGMVDMDSPQFKALFEFALETFKESMASSGCRPELTESVFTNLVSSLDDDWKQEARRRMKDSSQ